MTRRSRGAKPTRRKGGAASRRRDDSSPSAPHAWALISTSFRQPGVALDHDLPAAAWARLFACAVERLEQIDPDIGDIMLRDFLDFRLSWEMFARGLRSPGDRDRTKWIDDAVAVIRGRRLVGRGNLKTTGRRFRYSDRWLLLARDLARDGCPVPPEALTYHHRDRRKLSYKSSNALEAWIDQLQPPPLSSQ